MNIPNANDFLSLQDLSNNFYKNYNNFVIPIASEFVSNFHEADIRKTIEETQKYKIKIFEETLQADLVAKNTFNWLDNEPFFCSAFGKSNSIFEASTQKNQINNLFINLTYGYLMLTRKEPEDLRRLKLQDDINSTHRMSEADRHKLLKMSSSYSAKLFDIAKSRFEDKIKDKPVNEAIKALEDIQQQYIINKVNLRDFIPLYYGLITHSYIDSLGFGCRPAFQYIGFIAEIGRISNYYMSGVYKKHVTNAKNRLTKIKGLLLSLNNEVEAVLSSNWQINDLKELVLPYGGIEKSIQKIEELKTLTLSPAKRNDRTVQERLMIYDIKTSYKKWYGKDVKARALFKVMELPFINNTVEMKTIDRILDI